jgi:hypothetical protein
MRKIQVDKNKEIEVPRPISLSTTTKFTPYGYVAIIVKDALQPSLYLEATSSSVVKERQHSML